MRTRTLAALGAATVAATFAIALAAPHPVPETRRAAAAPAAMTFEVTPMPYQLPDLHPHHECGQGTTVPYPDSTDEITYANVLTTNGYIKVTAVLADQGREFARPLPAGWQVSPIAPYRAEYLTPYAVTECAPPPAPEPPTPEPGTPDANNCGA